MRDFLQALRADLTSRRMLPLVGLVSLALVAAIAYALLGSSGSSTPPPAPVGSTAATAQGSGIAPTAAPADSREAIAETAVGTRYQHHGHAHDPFTALPEPMQAQAASPFISTAGPTQTATGSPSGESSAGESSAGGSSGAGTGSEIPPAVAPEQPTKPSGPRQSTTVYKVSVHIEWPQQSTSAGTPTTNAPQGYTTTPAPGQTTTTPAPGQTTTPTPGATTTPTPGATTTPAEAKGDAGTEGSIHTNIPRGQELPDSQAPLLVFAGVLKGGGYAIFKLVGEVFPAGGSHCIPNTLQCEALRLAPEVKEQLSYTVEGETHTFEIEVDSIAPKTVSAAQAKKQDKRSVRAGITLLGESLPGSLRYSALQGVLVPSGH